MSYRLSASRFLFSSRPFSRTLSHASRIRPAAGSAYSNQPHLRVDIAASPFSRGSRSVSSFNPPTMAVQSALSSPSFTDLVRKSMTKLFPEELADRSWDNVGLLLGNIDSKYGNFCQNPSVLVTNDLTWDVAEEAVQKGVSVVVSYHPIIFSGLKAITTGDEQQATLILLASKGIAVYCPHTALDGAPKGINAWLADSVFRDAPHQREALRPHPAPPAGFEGAGAGLAMTAQSTQPAGVLVRNLASQIGMSHVMVASRSPSTWKDAPISKVAVCAGSGWDVLKGTDAELLITGEMSHHNGLKAVQTGKIVVTVLHSNSERGFLRERLVPWLEAELKATEPEARVYMSEVDRDPFEIVAV